MEPSDYDNANRTLQVSSATREVSAGSWYNPRGSGPLRALAIILFWIFCGCCFGFYLCVVILLVVCCYEDGHCHPIYCLDKCWRACCHRPTRWNGYRYSVTTGVNATE